MSNRRIQSPGAMLLAIGSATLAVIATVPGSSSAEPSPTIGEVQEQVERLYHEAETMTERANEYEDKMAIIARRARKLRADVERQQGTLRSLSADIGRFAAAEYRTGGLDTTVQLLVADDPDEFLARMSTGKAFTAQQEDLLRQLQAEQKRLAERQAVRRAELTRYAEAKNAATERKKIVARKAAQAEAILDRLTAEQRRQLEAAEERERASARSSRGDERIPPPSSGSGRGATALEFARAQLGEPYVFGAAGPDSWDCSGLTMMAWRQAGVSLPHSARQQYEVSPKVSRSELQPGDIVLFYDDLSHNGLYVGNGMILHAPRPGKYVEYIQMDYMPYYGAVRPG